jgi:hypothetical protein
MLWISPKNNHMKTKKRYNSFETLRPRMWPPVPVLWSSVDPEAIPLTTNDDNDGNRLRVRQSVEQRLLGLTTAMAEMKTTNQSTKEQRVYTSWTDPLTKTANVLVGHARDEIETRKEKVQDKKDNIDDDDDVEAQKEKSPEGDQGSRLNRIGHDVKEELES